MKKTDALTYTMLTRPDIELAEEYFKITNDTTSRIIEREDLPKEAWEAFIAEGKDPAKRRMKYAATYYEPNEFIREIRKLGSEETTDVPEIDYEKFEREKVEDQNLLSKDGEYSLRWK